MTKDNAKDFLPLVQALAEGKTLQCKYIDGWRDVESPTFDENYQYRIKPEIEYVPFDTVEELTECWKEKGASWDNKLKMPLIWVKYKKTGCKSLITDFNGVNEPIALSNMWIRFDTLLEKYTFLDGTPCGKLKE